MTPDNRFCSGCGRELPPHDPSGAVTCVGCGRVSTPPAGPPPVYPPPIHQPVQPPAGPPSRTGRSTAWIATAIVVPVVLVAFIGAIAIGLVLGGSERARGPGGATTLSSMSADQVSVLPGEPGEPTEVLALVQGSGADYAKQSLARVRLDGTQGDDAIVWRSDPVESFLDTSVVRLAGNRVFVATGDQLQLLALDTGDTRWTAELPDRLGTNCDDCVQLAGDALLVRSYDGTLSRFAPDSPQPTWIHRLERPEAPLIVAGDQTVVIDVPVGASSPQVQALDAATGEVAMSTPLSCQPVDEDMASYSSGPVAPIPGSDDLVAIIGSDAGCFARIDPAAGTTTWSTGFDDRFDTAAGDAVLLDEHHLVVTNASGLLGVDLDSGTATTMDELPDLRVEPNRILDGHVIAETTTERGSPRPGLASFDLSSGRSDWAVAVEIERGEADELIDPRRLDLNRADPTTQRVLISGQPDALLAVTFDDSEGALSVRTFDPAKGGLGEPSTRSYPTDEIQTDGPDLLVARDRSLLLHADGSLRRVPLPTGDIDSWPGG